MIVSWNWLKEYVRLDMPVEVLTDRLMLAGLNHESTAEVDGDFAIDLEVTSNRPDCLGHLGVAREVAALFGKSITLPTIAVRESETPISSLTSVTLPESEYDWCVRYRARLLQQVRVGPSPDWLRRRLKTIGIGSKNNVVDITNYVMFECGQPLHAFDFDQLQERRIVVRRALPKETFLPIVGSEKPIELPVHVGVIADGQRAVALGGVMGGAATAISESTTTVLLEAAEFLPLPIRKTSRLLDLASDSSYRFERKIDPEGVLWACERAATLICELAGATAALGAIDVGRQPSPPAPVELRHARIRRVLGIEVPPDRTKQILQTLGLTVVAESADTLTVQPPSFRRDLVREIDLIEEVARIYGYDQIPENRTIPLAVTAQPIEERLMVLWRNHLVQQGYCEAINYTFSNLDAVQAVRPWSAGDPLILEHSSRRKENVLRQSTLPSLLQAFQHNQAYRNDQPDLFELAQLLWPQPGKILPEEQLALGLVSTRDWRQVRGHIEGAFLKMGLRDWQFQPVEPQETIPGFDSAQTGVYLLAGQRVALLGYPTSATLQVFNLRSQQIPILAEILLMPLAHQANLSRRWQPHATVPSIERDLNFVFEDSVRWMDVEQTVRQAAGAALERLEFVELYRGKPIPAGKKSITFRLIYRLFERTLTSEEVDQFQQQVKSAVENQFGAELRA